MEFFNIFSGIVGCGGIAIFIIFLNKFFNNSVTKIVNKKYDSNIDKKESSNIEKINELKKENTEIKDNINKIINKLNKNQSVKETNDTIEND
jgi:hypothetical protein